MNKASIISLATVGFVIQGMAAQVTLFSTGNDFSGWSPADGTQFSNASVSNPDLDGGLVNGIGNLTSPGGQGPAGSLSLQWVAGTYDFAGYSPGEQGNVAFISALENASSLTIQFTTPPAGTGNYFNVGIVVNAQGRFDQLSGATTSLGGGITQETFDWTSEGPSLAAQQGINGGSYSYFQLGVIYNSNFTPGTPFNIDGIQVTETPEPTTLSLLGMGAIGVFATIRRRKA